MCTLPLGHIWRLWAHWEDNASDDDAKESLNMCLEQSVAKVRFVDDKQMSNWDVPPFTTGRYVRVQLEGNSFLHFAQLQVFGHETSSHGRPITSCFAGKFITAAVVGGMDRNGVEVAYQRAISADWYNADILRQFSTYNDEYRKECNAFHTTAKKCMLCVGDTNCEICSLKSRFSTELQQVMGRDKPYRLEDLADHLLSASNVEVSLKSMQADANEKIEPEDGGNFHHERGDENDSKSKVNILPILMKMKMKGSIL